MLAKLGEMKEPNLDSVVVPINQPEAAEMLTQLPQQQFISPFMGQNCTVSQAAAQLGLSPNSLLYRVERMLALGLLEVVELRKRSGRAIKVYRAPEAFFVPFALTKAETLEALFFPMYAHWLQRYVQSLLQQFRSLGPQAGVRVWRAEDGQIRTRLAWGPNKPLELNDLPPALSLWPAHLRLDQNQALSLQQELLDIYQKYAQCEGPAEYWLFVGLSPSS